MTDYSSQPAHPLFNTYEDEQGYGRQQAPAPLPLAHTDDGSTPPSPYGAGHSTIDYGSSPQPYQGRDQIGPPKKQRGRFGQFWATYKTPNQLMFLALIVLQAVTVLAMIALVYGTINSGTGDVTSETITANPQLESIATYLGLFILAELFEILVALDALQQKNIIQASLLIPFQIAVLIYSAVLPSQLHAGIAFTTADTPSIQHHVRAYAIVIPATIALVTLGISWLSYRLYEEFGWDVFKRIGADIQLKRMYFRYQIFVCLLKYDAFFFIGFSIQFLVLVSGTPGAEFAITIAAVPVILVCLVLAAVAVRAESRTGVYIFFVLDVTGVAYYLYKLVRIYDPASGDRYEVAKKTLTIFSIIALIMLIVTFIMTGLCLVNFGRGLKENMPPYYWGGGRVKRSGTGAGTSGSGRIGSLSGGQSAGAGEKVSGVGSKFGRHAGGGNGLRREETRMSLD